MSSYEKTTLNDPEDPLEATTEEKKVVDRCSHIYRGGFILFLVLALICLYYLSIFFIYSIYIIPDTEYLEARFLGHPHHKRLTCETVHEIHPEFYGCCEIVDENNQRFKTSVHRTLKRDEVGSNCPSYHSILLKAQAYYSEYSDYFQRIYGKPTDHNCVKENVLFPFKDCPSTQDIIKKYDLYFPSPYEDLYFIIITFVIMGCLLCHSGSGRR